MSFNNYIIYILFHNVKLLVGPTWGFSWGYPLQYFFAMSELKR